MKHVTDLLDTTARVLDGLQRSWAVVGGIAVSARVEPRFTRDVDIAISVSGDSDAEQLIRAFGARGFGAFALVEQEATGRIATVRLTVPGATEDDLVLDLLFASSGIEPELVAAATRLEITPGLRVPVPTIGHLIALKVLSRDDDQRPRDLDDLRNLLRAADAAELTRAEDALGLIRARGYHRGKDLAAELQSLRQRFLGH